MGTTVPAMLAGLETFAQSTLMSALPTLVSMEEPVL